MTKDEALKLALDALKHTHPSALTSFYTIGDRDKAIKAIQEHLAQPEQEPVKFEAVWDSGPTNKDYEDAMRLKRLQQLTTPPQSKPLTDEEIILIVAECAASHQHTDIHFARAIERAHGIKENK